MEEGGQFTGDDVGVPEFETILGCLAEGATPTDERVQGYVFLLELLKLVDGDALNRRIRQDMPLFCRSIRRDLGSSDQNLCSIALTTLRLLLQRKSFVSELPDDDASSFLLTLLALITTSRKKIVWRLGLQCLAVQELNSSALLQHVNMIVSVIVQGINNPMDSLEITDESLQAVRQMSLQLPEEMRDLSWIWVPPLCQKLLHKTSSLVQLSANCLSETQSVFLPPLPRLSEVVLLDIHQHLLSKIKEMIKLDGSSACVAVQAWGWFVRLLGSKAASEESVVKVMLKLLEDPFVSANPQVRIASQVAWVSIIDAFVSSGGDTGASGRPDTTSTPFRGFQLSHKRLKLLLVPLLNTMSWEKDKTVQRNCWCAWIYLLSKLGRWVNEKSIFDASVVPMLEIVFKLDPMHRDALVWQGCIDILTDIIACKRSEENGLDATTASAGVVQSPKTPMGITCLGRFSESHQKNITWSPWPLDRLESLIKILHLFWTSCPRHHPDEVCLQDASSTIPKDHLQAAQECWRLLARGVQAHGWNTVRPSDDQIAAVHLLLQHLNGACADQLPLSLRPSTWAVVQIFIDEWGPGALTSSIYKISLQSKEPADLFEDTDRDSVAQEDPLHVTPIVYISSAWFKLAFQTAATDGQREYGCLLQAVEKLISTVRAGYDPMRNYDGLAWILDHLASRSNLNQVQSPSSKKATEKGNAHEQNWCFLMAAWRMIANSVREQLEKSNDVPPIRGGQQNSGYLVVSRILLFPLRYFVLLSLKCAESITELEPESGRLQELETLDSEVASIDGPFIKLLECISRVSALTNPKPNSFIAGFFNKVAMVMNHCPHWLAGVFRSVKLWNGWHTFLGEVVAHVLETAEVSNLAMLAVSRKRRKAGYGASSVRVQYLTGMELEDVNNLRDILGVAGRLLIVWHEQLTREEMPIRMYEPVVRVFGAMMSLMQRVTSQNDSVLIFQVLARPLTCWLTITSQAKGSETHKNCQIVHFPTSVLERLALTWAALLSCLQNCRHQLLFDSNLLLAQAPILAPAFLHSHAVIANHTLSFWEKMYGSKAVRLRYPPQLVEVFKMLLLQKVNVTLPGWTARSSTAVTEESHQHDALESSSRLPHIKVGKQLGDRLQSMMNAVDKRAAKRQDQRHSSTRQMNFCSPAEYPLQPMSQQMPPEGPMQSAEKRSEDSEDLQSLVNSITDTNSPGEHDMPPEDPLQSAEKQDTADLQSLVNSTTDTNSPGEHDMPPEGPLQSAEKQSEDSTDLQSLVNSTTDTNSPGEHDMPPEGPLQSAEKRSEGSTDLQSLVNSTPDTNSPGEHGIFLPTPEANALIDSLVNMDSIPRSSSGENSKSTSVGFGTSDLDPTTDVHASTAANRNDADGQLLGVLNVVTHLTTGTIAEPKVDPTCCEGGFVNQNGRLTRSQRSQKTIQSNPSLVTPPIAFGEGPTIPPKLPAERPQGYGDSERIQATVVNAGRAKDDQFGSERPPRRKKLKFQDDGQELACAATPQNLTKRGRTRSREVRSSQRAGGHVAKTAAAVDFSQPAEGAEHDDVVDRRAIDRLVTAACKDDQPFCLFVERQRISLGSVTRGSASQAAPSSAEDDASGSVSDERDRMITLENVDYPKLKERLQAVLQEDPRLTYQEISCQEKYENLPRIIQRRLGSQATKLRKIVMNSTVTSTAVCAAAEKCERLKERPLQDSPVARPSSPGQCAEIQGINARSASDKPSHKHLEERPLQGPIVACPSSPGHRAEIQGISERPASVEHAHVHNVRQKRKFQGHRQRLSLRSASGKLRGGKLWRMESELERVMTGRLGIRKIVAKRRRLYRNLAESKMEKAVVALPEPPAEKEQKDGLEIKKIVAKRRRLCRNLAESKMEKALVALPKPPAEKEQRDGPETRKIVARGRRLCRNLAGSKLEKVVALPEPPTEEEQKNRKDEEVDDEEVPALADSTTQAAADFFPEFPEEGTPVQEASGHEQQDDVVPLGLPALAQKESSAVLMQNPCTTTTTTRDAMMMMTVRPVCHTTEVRQGTNHANAEIEPTSSSSPEVHEGISPFQVRKLNRGLLAGSYIVSFPSRTANGCAHRPTKPPHHNPRKRRAPKRTPSQEQFSSSSASSDAAIRSSPSSRAANISIAQPSEGGPIPSQGRFRRCTTSVSADPPQHPVGQSGDNPSEKGCSRRPETTFSGNPPLCDAEEGDPSEKSLSQNARGNADATDAAAVDEDDRLAHGGEACEIADQLGLDRRKLGRVPVSGDSPEPSSEREPSAEQDASLSLEPIGRVRTLLEKDGQMQAHHVLAALLNSSKWKDMALAEVSSAQQLLWRLGQELDLRYGHLEPRNFRTPPTQF